MSIDMLPVPSTVRPLKLPDQEVLDETSALTLKTEQPTDRTAQMTTTGVNSFNTSNLRIQTTFRSTSAWSTHLSITAAATGLSLWSLSNFFKSKSDFGEAVRDRTHFAGFLLITDDAFSEFLQLHTNRSCVIRGISYM